MCVYIVIVKIKFQLINIQRHNKTQRKSSLNNFVNCLMTCNRKKRVKTRARTHIHIHTYTEISVGAKGTALAKELRTTKHPFTRTPAQGNPVRYSQFNCNLTYTQVITF